MRLLVIDDDPDIRAFLKESFSAESFAVDTAADGADGSYMARVHEYDLVILDYVLPRKNGPQVLREIRAEGRKVPILVLSIQGEIDDKTDLLDLGADDYMTKPFSLKELLSRARALIRRPADIVPPLLKVGDLVLDTGRQRATRGDREIYLTRKEFALTEYLMRQAGNAISRGMLMEHVWNDSVDPFSNTIETHIRNIRRKIGDGSSEKLIHTVPGRGYKIESKNILLD
ncbi:MAG: response regulator transcription factor [Patescibacteria group bacterium]|nr:response regulator transcription factor [Patescibacteria group bacterium]MDE2116805.1 response regulator transcription factor [Patescibacteria group bacterium]